MRVSSGEVVPMERKKNINKEAGKRNEREEEGDK